ncbi:hypothetical protein [Pseudomonas chlororaphis]|uniref:hypothetical protein n=1 Tax=Pseudomonas chlororaphis TaxID=587753 RepID=UPI002D78EA65|nr:hypothetical protein [Pseudomonas chlororaphis]
MHPVAAAEHREAAIDREAGAALELAGGPSDLSQPAAAATFAQKKALPSGPRFYQSVVCLSFQHIPQRFEFRLAEQTSRVTIEDHPTRVGFPDLSRSIGLQPLRQNLKRLAIHCQGM